MKQDLEMSAMPTFNTLMRACLSANVEQVKRLLEQPSANEESAMVTMTGDSLSHLLAERSFSAEHLSAQLDVFKYLLEKQSHLIYSTTPNRHGQTALMKACCAIPVQSQLAKNTMMSADDSAQFAKGSAAEVEFSLLHIEKAQYFFRANRGWALVADSNGQLPSDIIHEKIISNEFGVVHEALHGLLSELQTVEAVSIYSQEVFSGKLADSVQAVVGG